MKKLLAISISITLFMSGFVTARVAHMTDALAQEESSYPLPEIRELSEAFNHIRKNYVDEIPDEKIMENAVRGMVGNIDAYSEYLSADEYAEFSKSLNNQNFGGVGMYLGIKDDYVLVIAPTDGTPASRAGVLAGDIIIDINGESTKGMKTENAVHLIRGEIGTIVTLGIVTPGESKRTIELKRENIVISSTQEGLAEPDYGYLRISRFGTSTVNDVIQSLNKLYEENERPLKGLVLDLRYNPGGLLHISIGVASIFLPEGVTVVTSRSRKEEENLVTARRHHINLKNASEIQKVEIVMLVDQGSASASEILAGALQDHSRATIIGTRTYGKASVQSVFKLSDDARVKLTIARYFTPSGKSIHAIGVQPDIEVQYESMSASTSNSETDHPFIPSGDNQYNRALAELKLLTDNAN